MAEIYREIGEWVKAEERFAEFIIRGTIPKADKMFSGSGEIPFIKVYDLTFDGTLDISKRSAHY